MNILVLPVSPFFSSCPEPNDWEKENKHKRIIFFNPMILKMQV
jgi:hypothetical protein